MAPSLACVSPAPHRPSLTPPPRAAQGRILVGHTLKSDMSVRVGAPSVLLYLTCLMVYVCVEGGGG